MYVQKTWKYGNRIERKKYHTARYGTKDAKRSRRQQPTTESMVRANERAAEKRLFRLLVGNFTEDDHFVTLTYRKEERPSAEESKMILKRFFGALRKAYRKAGEELRYIVTTEWNGRSIHHHLVANDTQHFGRILTKLWTYGGIHMTPMFQSRDYAGLAEYMIKETRETFRDEENPYRQRYSCSRNLKKPEETVEIISADSWRKLPAVPPSLAKQGYIMDIDSIVMDVDVFGYPYQEYVMIRKEMHTPKKRE